MLRRISERSSHSRNMHAAIILKGGRVISTGYNHGQTHAEIAAIHRATRPGGYKNLLGSTIISFMCRRRTGSIGNSKPCSSCMDAIRSQGIRRVVYYNGCDFVTVMVDQND